MASYTAKQYADQRRTSIQAGLAKRAGVCPVCWKRPPGIWPDGVQRATCGSDECHRKWLRARTEANEVDDQSV